MEVLLIRHAHSLHNAGLTNDLDSSLTKKPGCKQVESLGKWLSEIFDLSDFEGLTSPYLRCLQTACGICDATGLRFVAHGGPREYHIEKPDEGIRIPNREKEFSHCVSWPGWGSARLFANETIDEFLERVELFVRGLRPSGKYVIIGHGATVRTIHEVLVGNDLSPLKNRYSETIGTTSSIKNASVTWVVDQESRWFSNVDHELSEVDGSKRPPAPNP